MTQLIPLHSQTIGGNAVETVSARELHEFLGNGDMFAHWIKNRIEKYEFVENQDFVSFWVATQKPNGGRPSQEYYITLDMAKELSMVERNEKGREARKYFIECEKQLMQPKQMTPMEMVAFIANQMVEQERKTTQLEVRLQAVEQTQQRLDQDNNHYTIKGFCSLHNIDLSNGKMSALSRKAKKLSEVKEYTYHEISDPRFGKVKCYHNDILTELFQMQNLL